MQRSLLEPPQLVLGEPAGAERTAAPRPARPDHDRLAGPAPAHERRRPLFHPRRGWFRRFERSVNNFLAARVFPALPGLRLPYDRTLRRRLTLSETEVALPGLAEELDGLRILLVTDLHAGPFVSPAALSEALGRLMTVDPDVVVLGGDLVTCRLAELTSHAEAFERLRAPLGVWAVLGNHDHYTGCAPALRDALESRGIGVLHNRSVALRRAGAALSLAGVDDALLGSPDLDAALRDTRRPVVLLSHNPDLLFEAARRDVDLMLSGHTHAGQIRVPGLPVLVRQSRYRLDEGRYRTAGTELVVSRGLGAVGLPLRMACPPEGVLIHLRREDPP